MKIKRDYLITAIQREARVQAGYEVFELNDDEQPLQPPSHYLQALRDLVEALENDEQIEVTDE